MTELPVEDAGEPGALDQVVSGAEISVAQDDPVFGRRMFIKPGKDIFKRRTDLRKRVHIGAHLRHLNPRRGGFRNAQEIKRRARRAHGMDFGELAAKPLPKRIAMPFDHGIADQLSPLRFTVEKARHHERRADEGSVATHRYGFGNQRARFMRGFETSEFICAVMAHGDARDGVGAQHPFMHARARAVRYLSLDAPVFADGAATEQFRFFYRHLVRAEHCGQPRFKWLEIVRVEGAGTGFMGHGGANRPSSRNRAPRRGRHWPAPSCAPHRRRRGCGPGGRSGKSIPKSCPWNSRARH